VGLLAEPIAFAAIGVVVIVIVGAIDPHPGAVPKDPVTAMVVEVVSVIVIALGISTIAVAVIVAVPILRLSIDVMIVARSAPIEIAVRVSGAAIDVATAIIDAATAIVGERVHAAAARTAA
jgi:hypothetical protein